MNAVAVALRAQAAAERALGEARARALELQADALEDASQVAADDLLSAKNWPDTFGPFRAVREACRRGELPGVRVGHHPAFRRGDVLAWLQGRRLPVRRAPEQPIESEQTTTAPPRSKAARRALAEAEYRRDAGVG